MVKKIKTLTGLLLVLFIMVFEVATPAKAKEDEMVYEPFVVVSGYNVTDDIIIPGKNFKLTIEVENTDSKVESRGLLITLSFPDGISPAYGSSNQTVITSLKGGEKKEIVFDLYALPGYSRSTAPFAINITSEVRSSSATVYAPVQVDRSAFKVVSTDIPGEAEAGEKIAASISFKSLLSEKLSDVVLSVYVDNESVPVTTATIGNFYAEASKTQNLVFFIDEKGRHSLRFELSYALSEGDYSVSDLFLGTIMINEPTEKIGLSDSEIIEKSISGRDKMIIIGCLGLSVALGVGIVLIIKKYN